MVGERLLEAMDINLVVSIDSPDRATYESIRVNADFDRTMAHIERFAELVGRRGRQLTLVACPMSVNAHEMPALLDLCNRRGFHVGFNSVNHSSALTLRALPPERLAALMALYEAWDVQASDALREDNRRRFDGLRASVRALPADSYEPPGDPDMLQATTDRRKVWVLHPFNRVDRPLAHTLKDLVARLICDRYKPSGSEAQATIKVPLEGLGDRKEGLLAHAQACIEVVAEAESWSPEMTERAVRQMWVMYERMGHVATVDHTLGLDPRLMVESLVNA